MAEEKDLSPEQLKEILNEKINLQERNQPKFQSTRSILQFQDFDKDGLIDICDDLIQPITAPCKGPCVPNPSAIFPDWKTKDYLEPFLNPKLCYYQVAKVTPYKDTAPSAVLNRDIEAEINAVMKSRFEEFVDQVIDSLLTFEQKENTEETVAKVKEAIRYEKYYLDPKHMSRLQLLYSIPFDVIDGLPAAPPDEEDEEEDPPGTMYIEYEADQIGTMLIHVRKALDLYGRFHIVGQQLGDGSLKFVKSGSLFNLDEYGDIALFSSGILADLGTDLEVFLNKKGYQMVGVGAKGFFDDWFKDRITKIRVKVLNYKLQTIKIWTESCGQRPIHFNKKSCTALGRTSEAWKDPTAVAYFAKLWEMDQDINARVQIPWKEFVVKYTYPKIYVDTQIEITGEATIGSCIASALENEMKDLGQDIVNDVFSLGDAVAWRWRKSICRNDEKESRADDAVMGVSYEEFMEANMSEAFGMAQMQAFKRLAKDDQIFVQMCAMVLMSTTKFGPAMSAMSKLFEFGFQRLKWCGLLDLLQNAIKCLLGGLSFEDAVSSLIKSALNSMTTENFGKLMESLPADKQEEVRLKVESKIERGDFFEGVTTTTGDQAFLGSGAGGLASGTAKAAEAMGAVATWALKHNAVGAHSDILEVWKDEDVIKEERANAKPGAHGAPGNAGVKTGTSSGEADKMRTERTIVPELDNGPGNSGGDKPPVDGIMQLYMMALVDVYSDNLFILLDELNKFPGAEIVSSIIALMDCPRPPLFNPGIMDFIKSLGFPICRNMKEIKKIHMENPFQYFTDFADITAEIWKAIKWFVKQVIMIVLVNIMVKICEIIGRAICKALEAGGNILKSAITGEGSFEDAIKDAICGPDADDEQVQNTVIDLMDQLGMGGAALANRDDTLQFGADLSAALTKREMAEMFMGNASAESLSITDQIVDHEHPWMRDALPNKRSIGKFMGNIGNLFPLEYRETLREIITELPIDDMTPANPSMCASDEMIADFQALRCELLGGRASEGQCHKMFCDLREDMLQDLADLGDLTQGGIAEAIEKASPPIVSTPGCDDGMIPFESPMQIAVANQVLGGALDQLKIDYGKDMMGNGGFLTGDSSWGFINMVMSDTWGNPLTAHHRKAGNRNDYVNFATNLKNGGEPETGFWSFLASEPDFSGQVGQFPYWVGEWLMRQFLNAGLSPEEIDGYQINPSRLSDEPVVDGRMLAGCGEDLKGTLDFISHNELEPAAEFAISFDQLGFNGVIGQNVELIAVPDFGYNVDLRADFDYADHDVDQYGVGAVIIRRNPRKGLYDSGDTHGAHQREGADISLNFKDNARGMRQGGKAPNLGGEGTHAAGGNYGYETGTDGTFGVPIGSTWSYGFDLCAYYCDYAYDEDSGTYKNRFDDNMRVQMVEKVNDNATVTNPLSDQVGDEFSQALFDLPNWIESIPIVGWAIENLVNWILGLFWKDFNRIKGMPANADNSDSDQSYIMRSREFEFISVDDTLDVFAQPPSQYPNIVDIEGPGGIELSRFPKFAAAMEHPGTFTPPVYLLADMTNRAADGTLKTEYDSLTTRIYKDFAKEIGQNEIGWKYGATYDFLTTSDLIYGMDNGGEFVPYRAYPVPDGDGTRPLTDNDGILGISYDQFLHGEDARVIYLNPAQFGGSYTNPPLYVKPIKYEGWYGFINVFFPEETACKPHSTDLIDFDEVKQFIEKIYPNMAEDPRLTQDISCIREVPFSRIMDRGGKTGMYALILAAIRIYASVHFFKAMGTFSKIMPKFPDNFSTIYSAYIVERMEEDFKDVQGAFWEAFNTFKDDEFWYGFLEQSVECYNFLVSQGEIEQPVGKGFLQNSFDTINDLQTDYAFPYLLTDKRKYKDSEGKKRTQTVPGLMSAKALGDAGFFQTLEGYRESKNMEAVQSVDEDAKIILQQLVNRELTIMGEKLTKNMRTTGFNPTIFDLDFWIFQHKCQTSLQFLGPDLIEVPGDGIPTEPTDGLYTVGGEFRVFSDEDPDNGFAYADEYVGYYHVVLDEEGDPVYKAGETESVAAQDILTPVDALMVVKTVEVTWEANNAISKEMGTSSEYGPQFGDPLPGAGEPGSPDPMSPSIIRNPIDMGDVPDIGTTTGGGFNNPFAIEKYVSITKNVPGGVATKYTQEEAKSIIRSNNSSKLLSEVYPGSIKIVENEDGEMVGYSGHMGVRYGLNFYYTAHGGKTLITSVEVDALDLKVGQFRTMQASSKLLHCLLRNLKDDPKYKLMTQYIFSYKKATAMLAMYNDMAIMSSIGEVTTGEGMDMCGPPSPLMGKMFGAVWSDFRWADPAIGSDWIGNTMRKGTGTEVSGQGRHPAIRAKPGSICYIDRTEWIEEYEPPPGVGLLSWLFPNDDPIEVNMVNVDLRKSGVTGNEGWSHNGDRETFWFQPATWGVQEWDTWDRILLRNSRSRIKQLFRTYYNSRDYRPGDSLLGGKSPVTIFIKNLKAALMPSPGKGLLPWYKKGKTRGNPFNANGEMCDKNN